MIKSRNALTCTCGVLRSLFDHLEINYFLSPHVCGVSDLRLRSPAESTPQDCGLLRSVWGSLDRTPTGRPDPRTDVDTSGGRPAREGQLREAGLACQSVSW